MAIKNNPETFTLIGVTAIAWFFVLPGHELIGHGGINALMGGKAIYFDAMYFEGSELNTAFKQKFYVSGGTLYNILLGFLAAYFMSKKINRAGWLNIGLWLIMMMNLLHAGSYMLFGQVIHPGMDWSVFKQGLEPSWLVTILVSIFGVALIVAALKLGKSLFPAGITKIPQFILIFFVTTIVIGGIVGAKVPLVGDMSRWVMIGGSLGNSWLFLIPIWIIPFMKPKSASSNSLSQRLWIPIVLGTILSLVYIFVIAKGIYF